MESSSHFREAALALGAELTDVIPVASVGVGAENGSPLLIVYISRRLRGAEATRIPPKWRGMSVRVSLFGKMLPAAG